MWVPPVIDDQVGGKRSRTAPWNVADTLWAQCPDLLAARELAPHLVGRNRYTVIVHGVRVLSGWQCGVSNTPSVSIPEKGVHDLRPTVEPPRRKTIDVIAMNDTVATNLECRGGFY